MPHLVDVRQTVPTPLHRLNLHRRRQPVESLASGILAAALTGAKDRIPGGWTITASKRRAQYVTLCEVKRSVQLALKVLLALDSPIVSVVDVPRKGRSVAAKNLDRAWEDWAIVDPYYAVLADPTHWGGAWAKESEEFFRSGTADVESLLEQCRRHGLRSDGVTRSTSDADSVV